MRLLIVDDSQIERMILKEMLQAEGHTVEEAENGKQALKQALLSQPDMIISDILMPVMDGFKLCREIRADHRTCDIPFVFYTGTYTKTEDEEFAFKMGADRFLVKNMEWEKFFRELQDVIKEKKMGEWNFPERIPKDEKEIYKLYSERLIKKLEDKVTELESEVSWRKKLEKQLFDSQESLQMALDGAHLGMWDWNVQTGEAKFNPQWAQSFGYTPEELLPHLSTWEKLLHPDDRQKAMAALQANLSGTTDVYESEHRLKDKDGFWHWFLAKGKVVSRDTAGEALRHVGTFLDITDRVEAKKTLEKSEKKYRTILEKIEDGYFEVDLTGNLAFFNKALCDILGYPESELKGKNYRSFMNAQNAKKTFQTFNRVFETGEPLKGFDWKIIRKNGTGGYLDTSVSPVKDKEENVIGFRGIARDVSERRLMEQFLAESEERYRLIFESAPAGIFHYDKKGIIRACNQAYVDINGSSLGKLIGFNLLESVTNQLAMNAVKKSLAGSPGHYEGEYTSVTGGRTSYIKADFVPVLSESKNLDGGMCVVEDITERKKAEDALNKSEREAGVLLNATTDAAVLLDPDGIIININDTFANRFNKNKGDIIGKCIWSKFSSNITISRKDYVREVFETGKPVTVVDEFQGIWDYTNIFPVLDASEKVTRVAVFAQDITDRKRAEEALRESEERYRGLAERSPGIILLSSLDGVCQFVSPSIERLLGYRPEEVIGTVPGDFYSPQEAGRLLELLSRVGKGETVRNFEVRLVRKDGSPAVLELEGIPVRRKGRVAGVQYLGRDITDRKIAEEELKKSRQQLRALSKHLQQSREQERAAIAREIHDDLGQSLTAIKMDISWLQGKIPEDQEVLRHKAQGTISLIDSAIQSVKRISAELRPGLLDDLGLPAAVEWQAGDYQKRSGININVSIAPEEIFLGEDLSIAIFRVCQESLTNIVRHSGATDAWVDLSKNSSSVELVVTDNGSGISEKEIAKKNSFGLIGMRERIHSFGGRIKISRIQDGGTKIAVRVPLDK